MAAAMLLASAAGGWFWGLTMTDGETPTTASSQARQTAAREPVSTPAPTGAPAETSTTAAPPAGAGSRADAAARDVTIRTELETAAATTGMPEDAAPAPIDRPIDRVPLPEVREPAARDRVDRTIAEARSATAAPPEPLPAVAEPRVAAPVAPDPVSTPAAVSTVPAALPAAPSLPEAPPAPASTNAPAANTESVRTPAPVSSGGDAAASTPVLRADGLVRSVLNRYEAAYTRLDASAAGAVWPSLDRRALARAFEGLESQQISLTSCDISVSGGSARADCSGTARWTPKVGGGAQSASRRWQFTLRNDGGEWVIASVNVRNVR